MMMLIQLRCILIHHLLRKLHCISPMQLRLRLVSLLIWVLVDEQILDRAFPSNPLVNNETRHKLIINTDLYRIQHEDGEVLTIVADEVVGGSFGSHLVDDHFA